MKKKILLVEDDSFLSDLYSTNLNLLGYDVSRARDGAAAMKMVQDQTFDLVLLDLLLPKISGFEVLKKIRELDKTNKCYIIILSNLSQQEEIAKGQKLGADEYLVKANFTPQDIIDKVKIKLT